MIYTELLDFDGDEIYFQEEPAVVGKQFGEALLAYEDSSLIGLRRHDGTILLNPPMDLHIASGDKVIAISSDDDTIRCLRHHADGRYQRDSYRDVTPDDAEQNTDPGVERARPHDRRRTQQLCSERVQTSRSSPTTPQSSKRSHR